jgi:hypothetical protein
MADELPGVEQLAQAAAKQRARDAQLRCKRSLRREEFARIGHLGDSASQEFKNLLLVLRGNSARDLGHNHIMNQKSI